MACASATASRSTPSSTFARRDHRGRSDDQRRDNLYQRSFSAGHHADLKHLRPSEPDEHTLPTLVREGATIGAGSTIGNDLAIGRFAMVGMGSLVTKSVPDFHLAIGHPATSVGYVCRCGQLLARFPKQGASELG